MDSLVAEVIPGLKRKATAINGRITQIRRDIDEKDKAVKELQEEESVAKSCSDDISQIDTALVMKILLYGGSFVYKFSYYK